jgi:hypothetical protein
MNHTWDLVQNSDFKSDCILGFFRNHSPSDVSRMGERFGILTAVKYKEIKDGARYEENYSRRWLHFRPATEWEVEERTIKIATQDTIEGVAVQQATAKGMQAQKDAPATI